MKKVIQKISPALQVLLMALVKLPGRVLNIIKYIALGFGVVETVLDDQEKKGVGEFPPAEPMVQQQEKEEVPDEME